MDELDYLDVDIVDEDSGALPVGAQTAEKPAERPAEQPEPVELPLEFVGAGTESDKAEDVVEAVAQEQIPEEELAVEPEAQAEPEADPEPDGTADEYEYVEDTSGLEPEADEGAGPSVRSVVRDQDRSRGQCAQVPVPDPACSSPWQRPLIGSAAAAFLLTPAAWYACATLAVITLLYLAYLRRQTRIEERLRRRRMHRMARARLGVENTDDNELDVVPARLRRPGAAVLEIDDEDPVFEHLDYAPFAREFDLPRAAGQ